MWGSLWAPDRRAAVARGGCAAGLLQIIRCSIHIEVAIRLFRPAVNTGKRDLFESESGRRDKFAHCFLRADHLQTNTVTPSLGESLVRILSPNILYISNMVENIDKYRRLCL
jgi:hypothetical protein